MYSSIMFLFQLLYIYLIFYLILYDFLFLHHINNTFTILNTLFKVYLIR